MLTVVPLFTAVLSQQFNRYDISQCIGVWSADSVGGELSTLEISIQPINPEGKLAVAAFNFKDRFRIQAEELIPDYKICSTVDVNSGVCQESELDKFHVKESNSNYPVLNELLSWSEDKLYHSDNVTLSSGVFKLRYSVVQTGFYCIFLGSEQSEEGIDFKPIFTVSSSYGKLPAIFLPALAFFFILSIIYTVIGIAWMLLSFWYWKALLTIQHYVSGVIAFLIVEMAFNYGFYENYNSTGIPSSTLLTLVVTLNSARNSIAFLMILLVSLGHGVVKPSLGSSVMKGCLALTGAHFLFGTFYGTATLVSGDVNSKWVFLFTIPLSVSMTAFYSWTLKGLEDTINHLKTRRQGVKLLMYQRLYYILALSIIAILIIFVANAVNLSHRDDPEWISTQWKWRWMLLDGALNFLFLVVFCSIAFLWMPTANNERYGLDQIPSDDYDEAQVLSHNDDSPIKLRNFKSGQENSDDIDQETAEEILRWAEDNFDADLTPSNSDDKLA